jgi:tripartite-type tricarboxylate transporter receptor subunit TctC
MIGRTGLALVVAVSISTAIVSLASAQNYPTRPITVVYPFAPGGSADIMLRSVSEKVSETLGQPIVIESRPGAGTTVGAKSVARSNPDGYTLLSATNATLVIAPSIYPNVGYDPRKDFAPIGLLGQSASVLVVHPSFPARSIAELIALAKRSDKTMSFGSPGTGTPTHLSGELLAAMASIKLAHVPYRGAPQALADVLGGHIQFVFSAIPNVQNHIRSGTLRALAVSSGQRSPLLPAIPTVSESGLTGFDTAIKYYLVAPAGTPPAIVYRLNAALRSALLNEEVRRKFAAEGAEPATGTFEEYVADLDREEAKWPPLVKSLGLKPE